jgi:hypothetical protein
LSSEKSPETIYSTDEGSVDSIFLRIEFPLAWKQKLPPDSTTQKTSLRLNVQMISRIEAYATDRFSTRQGMTSVSVSAAFDLLQIRKFFFDRQFAFLEGKLETD